MTSSKRSPIEQVLPADYAPGNFTVLVGRRQKCVHHAGNQRLQAMVMEDRANYEASTSRSEKSMILLGIVRKIRGNNKDGIGFVRHDKDTDTWHALTEEASRVVVAQAFRDAVGPAYKSSRKIKQIKQTERRRKANIESPSSALPPVESSTCSKLSVEDAIKVARVRNQILSRTGIMPDTVTHVLGDDGKWGTPKDDNSLSKWGIPAQSHMSFMAQRALAAQQAAFFSSNFAAAGRFQGFAPQADQDLSFQQYYAMKQELLRQQAVAASFPGAAAWHMSNGCLPKNKAALSSFHKLNEVIELDEDDDDKVQVSAVRSCNPEDEETSVVTQYSEPRGHYPQEAYAPRNTRNMRGVDPPAVSMN